MTTQLLGRLLIALSLTACSGTSDDGTDNSTVIPRDGGTAPSCTSTKNFQASRGAGHVAEPEALTYVDTPPSSGNHRPQWGKWGEYSELPPERWLHNLEHGGVALLYAPGDTQTRDELLTFARAQPADDGGAFRYILAPYAGLPQPVGAVAWEWTYLASGVCADELKTFVSEQYRRAPEDVASDGAFGDNWIAR